MRHLIPHSLKHHLMLFLIKLTENPTYLDVKYSERFKNKNRNKHNYLYN